MGDPEFVIGSFKKRPEWLCDALHDGKVIGIKSKTSDMFSAWVMTSLGSMFAQAGDSIVYLSNGMFTIKRAGCQNVVEDMMVTHSVSHSGS